MAWDEAAAPERTSGFGLDAPRGIDLPEQFLLGRGPVTPMGWQVSELAGYTLARHPSLPCIEIVTEAGRALGWLLGYPIVAGRGLLRDGSSISCTDAESVGALLDALGGRHAALLVGLDAPRVELDACGSLSLVFSPTLGLVASTTNLIPWAEGTRAREDLNREMGIPYRSAMYPVGLTARHGVERLLPNHTLDLTRFEARRTKRRNEVYDPCDVGASVTRIAELTRQNIEALVDAMPCYLPLTAGRDSRMLLACARERVSELAFYTVLLPDRAAQLDGRIARRLASRHRLDHLALRMRDPIQADLEEWNGRIASGVGEFRGWQSCTTNKRLDAAYSHLLGNVGEVARSYFWRRDDHEGTQITPERLVEHCKAPTTEETLAAARAWLDAAPTDDALALLDLFYVEQRLGCWAGLFPYADYQGPGFTIFPMCHPEIVRRMAALPVRMRRDGSLMEAVVRQTWPELLEIPFNREVGIRRLWQRVSRRARMLSPRAPRLRRSA